MITILILIIILIVALTYAANNKKNPRTNSYWFLVFFWGALLLIALNLICRWDKGEYFVPKLLTEVAFASVSFGMYVYQKMLYLQSKKKEDNLDHIIIEKSSKVTENMDQEEGLKPYDEKRIKDIISNDFNSLDEHRRNSMKWIQAKMSKMTKEEQDIIIENALCFLLGFELPERGSINRRNIPHKKEILTQEDIGTLCSLFRGWGKTSKDCMLFVKKVFRDFFPSYNDDEDLKNHIDKKTNSPETFVMDHQNLFTDKIVAKVKSKQEKDNKKKDDNV